MNLVMNKDFAGMILLIGRMHLETYLRTKYLQRLKALVPLTVRSKETDRVDYNLAKQIDEEWGNHATLFFIEKVGPRKIAPQGP